MAQAVLVTVGGWQRRSSEVSNRVKDGLITVVKQGFDAMAALLEKDSDPQKVQGVLRHFDVSRSIAFQFDKAKDDPLRDLVYGLLESMHASLNEWNEERNQRKKTGEFSTQTERDLPLCFIYPIIPSYEASLPMDNHASHNQSSIPESSRTVPIAPKEDPIKIHQSLPANYQISDSELMRDEKLFKEEEMGNENNQLIAAISDPILSDSLNILEQPLNSTLSHSVEGPTDFFQVLPRHRISNPLPSFPVEPKEEPIDSHQAVHEEISTSELMRDAQLFNDKEEDNKEGIVLHSHPPFPGSLDFLDQMAPLMALRDEMDFKKEELLDDDVGASETSKIEMRKRLPEHVSRPIQYTKSMDYFDDNSGPLMKKSRSDSTTQNDIGQDKLQAVINKPSRVNTTVLECPECEFHTRIAGTWVNHLRCKHSTTPKLVWLSFVNAEMSLYHTGIVNCAIAISLWSAREMDRSRDWMMRRQLHSAFSARSIPKRQAAMPYISTTITNLLWQRMEYISSVRADF